MTIRSPKSTQARRGITLLFVLSLIVLFLLMGAAFVSVSGNFMRTSRARARLELRGDTGRTLVQRALFEALRGPALDPAPARSLYDHNLLADQYGTSSRGQVETAALYTNPQFIQLTLRNPLPPNNPDELQPTRPGDPPFPLSDASGAYDGQVLTFVDDPLQVGIRGQSFRIFHYQVDTDASGNVVDRYFLIVPPLTAGQDAFANPANLVNANVVINGRDFAPVVTGPPPFPIVNEPYDAVDEFNVFLAAFERGAANPQYASFYGPLDAPTGYTVGPVADNTPQGKVDTDGDGVEDARWVDPFWPIQYDSNGKAYKIKVAYQITDLDGRFNLNVHGNENEATGSQTGGSVPLLGSPGDADKKFGIGYGPAEVSLLPIFPGGYVDLLDGNANYRGRYGAPNGAGIFGPGIGETFESWSQVKLLGYPLYGIGNTAYGNGSLFGMRMDLLGDYAWGFPDVLDRTGQLPFGMPWMDAVPPTAPDDDLTDNPYEMKLGGPVELTSSYASRVGSYLDRDLDQLFSAKELERILRIYDIDAPMLPSRLLDLLPAEMGDPDNRRSMTTDTWEVPVPPQHYVEPLRQILAANGLNPGQVNQQISLMLAPELVRGLKFDLNRPFGNGIDDDGDGIVDEYDDVPAGGEQMPYFDPAGVINGATTGVLMDLLHDGYGGPDNNLIARQVFARHLYCLAVFRFGTTDVNGDGMESTTVLFPDPADALALAQWAINVVDFRDPDAIMTPFDFDPDLRDGWQVVPGGAARVWGCERPELLLSETLAVHDRRTEDLSGTGGQHSSSGGTDEDFDSRLRPVDAAFIELYAPQVGSGDITYPAELYGANGIDLARRTRDGTPVWRVLVVRHVGTTPAERGSELIYNNPSLTDVNDNRNRDPDITGTGSIGPGMDNRVLYFTDPPAAMDATANAGKLVFFPSPGIQGLRGNWELPLGSHAVIGSSGNVLADAASNIYTTTFGRRNNIGQANEGNPTSLELANTRKIQLDPVNNQVRVRDYQVAAAGMITRVRTDVLALPVDRARIGGVTEPRSFNVSDPQQGYPPIDAMGNPVVDVGDGYAYQTPFDEPLINRFFDPNRLAAYGSPDPESNLTEYNALRIDRTTPTWKVVHLQRLADPTADFDPVANPYRTVDSMSLNLTAFNGVSATDDPSSSPLLGDALDLASMERGRNRKYPPRALYDATASVLDEQRNLWSQDGFEGAAPRHGYLMKFGPAINEIRRTDRQPQTLSISAAAAGQADEHIFDNTVFETLGAFNDAWYDSWLDGNSQATNQAERGRINPGYAASPGYIVGRDANLPFNWLTWFNRPFANQLELSSVPIYPSSQLLARAFSSAFNPSTGLPKDPYPASNVNQTGFGYLPNWFNDRDDTYFSAPGSPTVHETEWSSMLDYVTVPSRYLATEQYFHVDTTNPAPPPIFGINPPYNHWSRFREPGKVNLNTILDDRVWNGLMGEYAIDMQYTALRNSRGDAFTPTSSAPTNWRPFRPNDAKDWIPGGTTTAKGVETGLFRSQLGVGAQPLLDFVPVTQLPHNNTNRNAFFRYLARQRMGGMTTTRSSVYAIWITVGYFEVDPLNPNGPTLGEIGTDTGNIVRHRGFYIYDRSIPVAFEPGVNHNIENAILVESYIE